jgi:hypothetical protein
MSSCQHQPDYDSSFVKVVWITRLTPLLNDLVSKPVTGSRLFSKEQIVATALKLVQVAVM